MVLCTWSEAHCDWYMGGGAVPSEADRLSPIRNFVMGFFFGRIGSGGMRCHLLCELLHVSTFATRGWATHSTFRLLLNANLLQRKAALDIT